MTNKKEHKILRKALSLTLAMLVSILGLPLAEPQQVSATETSDPKYLSSITMNATASSSWDTNYDTALYATLTGSGYTNSYKTEATALQISSATQLAAFARAVNVGGKDFSGKYVKLTAPIDLGGTNPTVTKKVDESDSSKFTLNITGTASNVWVPIGNSTTRFKGNFDGDGHEVSNMTVLVKSTSGNIYAGLFGCVDGGSIKNTGVTGDVYASSSYAYAGGLVGSSSSSISNSYATGDVYASSSSAYAGGLVGTSYSNISNSYATGDVYVSSSSSYSSGGAGGLAGWSGGSSSITNSYATGNVSVSSSSSSVYAGGLAGYSGSSSSSSSSISNSYATGNVSTSSSKYVYAGGLIGSGRGSITNGYYYSGATIDGGTGATISKDGTGLALEQMTGNRKGRAKDNITGFSEDNWEFPGDNGLIKYLPRLKVITYNETTNPAPRLVGPISSDFDFKSPANLTYNGSQKVATVTSEILEVTNDKITVKYYNSAGTKLTSAPTNAGTYTVKIDVAEGDNYEAKTDITADNWKFTIAKANPTIKSISTSVTYKPGLTLKDVPYPSILGTEGSWAWSNSSISISAAGTYTYLAKYTPTNTTNYNSAEEYIKITVNKADPTIGSTSTTAAYKPGLILSNVTPPLRVRAPRPARGRGLNPLLLFPAPERTTSKQNSNPPIQTTTK